MFAPNLPALSVRNQVLTWDLRGHGGSGYPPDPASYSAAAALADMTALLDEAGLDRAVLGGHSLGGYLSLDFALTNPGRVAGLILIDTGPGFRNDAARDDWNRRAEVTASRLGERGLEAVRGSAELHGGEHKDATGLILAALGTLTQQDSHVLDGLPRIGVPTLIVVGADDSAFLGAADYMAAKIPDARLVVIPDAGHAPNIDKPSLFNAEVGAFLDRFATAAAPS
jgi:pimeloyl-ACP methyl ester carboxylesterase